MHTTCAIPVDSHPYWAQLGGGPFDLFFRGGGWWFWNENILEACLYSKKIHDHCQTKIHTHSVSPKKHVTQRKDTYTIHIPYTWEGYKKNCACTRSNKKHEFQNNHGGKSKNAKMTPRSHVMIISMCFSYFHGYVNILFQTLASLLDMQWNLPVSENCQL